MELQPVIEKQNLRWNVSLILKHDHCSSQRRTLRNGTTTACYFATIHTDASLLLCQITGKIPPALNMYIKIALVHCQRCIYFVQVNTVPLSTHHRQNLCVDFASLIHLFCVINTVAPLSHSKHRILSILLLYYIVKIIINIIIHCYTCAHTVCWIH